MLKSIWKVRIWGCCHLELLANLSSLDLLVPLTSAAKLPKHPSISVAYTSPILTKMAEHASEMVQRERSTLADAKRLMTRLRGDEIWLPCGIMYSDSDEQIFDTEKLYNRSGGKKDVSSTNGIAASVQIDVKKDDASLSGSLKSFQSGMGVDSARAAMMTSADNSTMNVTNGVKTTEVNDIGRSEQFPKASPANATGSVAPEEVPGTSEAEHAGSEGQEMRKSPDPTLSTAGERAPEGQMETSAGESTILDPGINGGINLSPAQNNGIAGNGCTSESAAEKVSTQQPVVPDSGEPREDEVMDGIEEQDEIKAEPRRMRTRAQAQAASEPIASSRTESPDSYIPPEIHPLFKMPESAIPDKDFGLPPMEADETRRLLTLYVQKQEEVCRGAERLYEGLLHADQQRSMVLKWCKAEDHVGEMSDGEDWYDKEEWGLEEDLEKGHNDEEGETNNAIQGRKPRRRA